MLFMAVKRPIWNCVHLDIDRITDANLFYPVNNNTILDVIETYIIQNVFWVREMRVFHFITIVSSWDSKNRKKQQSKKLHK